MSGRLLVYERLAIVRAQPVAVVTGAARNIGSAIASRLQDDGYQIVATVFEGEPPSDGAPATVSKLEADELARKNDWDVVLLDLADPSASEELVSYVRERYGRLDCLVNNAATWTYGPALSISDERWRNVLDVNVLALVRLVRESHPLLREAPAARIVNLSSIGAEWSGNGVAPYCVSKAAVSALTRALSVELADDGIAVNAVAPGFIEASSNSQELDDPAALERRLSLIPAGRPGKPTEVADAVSFLASPTLGFVTGSILRIDGGQSAGARSTVRE